tara:strand:+ start:1413 stop:1856 length:444 start_codon:yes stop_codon:yes gene_type:complete
MSAADDKVADAMEALEAALREQAAEAAAQSITDALVEICESDQNGEGPSSSRFVSNLLARGVKPPTIIWMTFLMLEDLAKREWVWARHEKWAPVEGEPDEMEPTGEYADGGLRWYGGGGLELRSSLDEQMFCLIGDEDAVYTEEGEE